MAGIGEPFGPDAYALIQIAFGCGRGLFDGDDYARYPMGSYDQLCAAYYSPDVNVAPTYADAYWRLNEQSGTVARDRSRYGASPGTYSSVVQLDAAGGPVKLDPSGAPLIGNGNIQIENDLGSTGDVTIVIWFNAEGSAAERMLFDASTAASGLRIYKTVANDIVADAAGGGTVTLATSLDWIDNAWYGLVVVATASATNAWLGLAGEAPPQTLTGGAVINRAIRDNYFLGCGQSGGDPDPPTAWNWYIDEIAIYKSDLSATHPTSWPRFHNCAGFGTGYETRWTTVTEYVQRWSTRRGRNAELDKAEAGTGSLTLLNTAGHFTPGASNRLYDSSTLQNEVVPMKPVRIMTAGYDSGAAPAVAADVAGASGGAYAYPINQWQWQFRGWAEGFNELYDLGAPAVVEVPLADAVKPLSLEYVTVSETAATGDVYVNAILDAAQAGTSGNVSLADVGWPVEYRRVRTGKSTLLDYACNDAAAWGEMQRIADAEFGFLFVDVFGRVCWEDRHARQNIVTYTDAAISLSNAAESTDFGEVEIKSDDALIYNRVTLSNEAQGETTISAGTASNDRYATRSVSYTGLLTPTASLTDYASYLGYRYSNAARRVEGVSFVGWPIAGTTWAALAFESVLSTTVGATNQVQFGDLGTRLAFTFTPSHGEAISMDVHVEGIDWDVGPGGATMNLAIYEASSFDMWSLGYSRLTTETALGY